MFEEEDNFVIEEANVKAHKEAVFRTSITFILVMVAAFFVAPFISYMSGNLINPPTAFMIIYMIDFFSTFAIYRYFKGKYFRRCIDKLREKSQKN